VGRPIHVATDAPFFKVAALAGVVQFTTGPFDLSGVKVKALERPAIASCVRMGGTYKTAEGLFLAFGTETVTIGACGKPVEDGRPYSVTRHGNLLDVSISNASKPLVVSLEPGGRITGPAAFDVDGRIITGYRTYWVQERWSSDNSVVPGSGHEVQEPNTPSRIFRIG
jgi:hypothetical protein